MPLKGFSNRFVGSLPGVPLTISTTLEKEDVGRYFDLKIVYNWNEHKGVAFNIEHIGISATGSTEIHRVDIGNTSTCAKSWEFTIIPVVFSLEYYIIGRDKKLSPVIGIGYSVYFGKIALKETHLEQNLVKKYKYSKLGPGIHVYIGILYNIRNTIFIESRLKARKTVEIPYGFRFSYSNIEFTGVDFTLGVGWRF